MINVKYLFISSNAGDCRRMFDRVLSSKLEPVSEEPEPGIKVAASGEEEYRSCRRVRPNAMTGAVA